MAWFSGSLGAKKNAAAVSAVFVRSTVAYVFNETRFACIGTFIHGGRVGVAR